MYLLLCGPSFRLWSIRRFLPCSVGSARILSFAFALPFASLWRFDCSDSCTLALLVLGLSPDRLFRFEEERRVPLCLYVPFSLSFRLLLGGILLLFLVKTVHFFCFWTKKRC